MKTQCGPCRMHRIWPRVHRAKTPNPSDLAHRDGPPTTEISINQIRFLSIILYRVSIYLRSRARSLCAGRHGVGRPCPLLPSQTGRCRAPAGCLAGSRAPAAVVSPAPDAAGCMPVQRAVGVREPTAPSARRRPGDRGRRADRAVRRRAHRAAGKPGSLLAPKSHHRAESLGSFPLAKASDLTR